MAAALDPLKAYLEEGLSQPIIFRADISRPLMTAAAYFIGSMALIAFLPSILDPTFLLVAIAASGGMLIFFVILTYRVQQRIRGGTLAVSKTGLELMYADGPLLWNEVGPAWIAEDPHGARPPTLRLLLAPDAAERISKIAGARRMPPGGDVGVLGLRDMPARFAELGIETPFDPERMIDAYTLKSAVDFKAVTFPTTLESAKLVVLATIIDLELQRRLG